jgi:hypothetical protein
MMNAETVFLIGYFTVLIVALVRWGWDVAAMVWGVSLMAAAVCDSIGVFK